MVVKMKNSHQKKVKIGSQPQENQSNESEDKEYILNKGEDSSDKQTLNLPIKKRKIVKAAIQKTKTEKENLR